MPPSSFLTLESPQSESFSVPPQCWTLSFGYGDGTKGSNSNGSNDGSSITYQLRIILTLEQYQQADQQALFNNGPDLRTSEPPTFSSDYPITLTAILKPEYSYLLDHTSNPESVAEYLISLSASTPGDTESTTEMPKTADALILLQTESWLTLSVRQTQPSSSAGQKSIDPIELGYDTFWNHINPHTLYNAADSGEQLLEEITTALTRWVTTNLIDTTKTATETALNDISKTLESALDSAIAELNNNLSLQSTSQPSLFEQLKSFFTGEDWPYAESSEDNGLQLAFEGESGRWNCYAFLHEEPDPTAQSQPNKKPNRATVNKTGKQESQHTLIFYSLCPISIPENQRQTISTLITRANFGTILGNFELDLDNGDLLYKTCLPLEKQTLPTTLLERAIYTNIAVMDHYLPSILDGIYGEKPESTNQSHREIPESLNQTVTQELKLS